MLKRLGLHRLFGRSVNAERDQQATVDPPLRNLWIRPNPGTLILIIDDSKTTQAVVAKKLRQQGYDCLAAYDGESGIELARQHTPALILMDVIMPGINGFQATRLIRRDERISQTPVVIMSGNKEATDQFWSIKIGANDFMIKPFTDDDLFSSIEKCLYPGAHNDTQLATEPA